MSGESSSRQKASAARTRVSSGMSLQTCEGRSVTLRFYRSTPLRRAEANRGPRSFLPSRISAHVPFSAVNLAGPQALQGRPYTGGFMTERLFTPRFVTMFFYSFTVFVSVFQLLPAAPYRVIAIGGSTAVAGLFQGVLTFSSALSAAFTGPITDRLGHRPVLIVVSVI